MAIQSGVSRPVELGPFRGGMDNWAGQATIADNELFLLENGEIDTDGSIISRPAFVFEETTFPHTGTLNPLGYYVRADGETFLVVATAADTQIYQLDTKTWTTIWSTPAASFTQYDNKIVMCSTTVAGAYWDGTLATLTAVPTMPAAQQIVLYQSRFWLFGVKGSTNATTLWFSNLNVISPPSSIYTFDTTNNFITIARGDGQWITCLVADTNALIIFRSSSTYQFTYPSAPSTGTVRVLSNTIGADNQWAVVFYQSYYYVQSQGYLYQFINYRFYPLNTKKIKFVRGSLVGALIYDIRLSIYGNRVILWYYGSVYLYNTVTTSWSVWTSPTTSAAMFFTVPTTSASGASRSAIAVSGETNAGKQRLWRISDDPIATGGSNETFSLHVITKLYDLSKPVEFKRMTHWAVEVLSASGVDGIAHPVSIGQGGTTWNAMAASTWNTLTMGTWNNPLLVVVAYEDNTAYPTSAPQQETIKLTAAIRFIRVFFELSITVDGTSLTSPTRILAIIAFLLEDAQLAQKVS